MMIEYLSQFQQTGIIFKIQAHLSDPDDRHSLTIACMPIGQSRKKLEDHFAEKRSRKTEAVQKELIQQQQKEASLAGNLWLFYLDEYKKTFHGQKLGSVSLMIEAGREYRELKGNTNEYDLFLQRHRQKYSMFV